MTNDRNGGRPPLDEVLDALKAIYLVLLHSSRSKRTIRQTNVLRRCYVILGDGEIAVPRPIAARLEALADPGGIPGRPAQSRPAGIECRLRTVNGRRNGM
jgi:hypothetical protein